MESSADSWLFYSLMYPRCLEWCLAHSRCSKTVGGMHSWTRLTISAKSFPVQAPHGSPCYFLLCSCCHQCSLVATMTLQSTASTQLLQSGQSLSPTLHYSTWSGFYCLSQTYYSTTMHFISSHSLNKPLGLLFHMSIALHKLSPPSETFTSSCLSGKLLFIPQNPFLLWYFPWFPWPLKPPMDDPSTWMPIILLMGIKLFVWAPPG